MMQQLAQAGLGEQFVVLHVPWAVAVFHKEASSVLSKLRLTAR